MSKEQYFTEESILQKTNELLNFVSSYRTRHADLVFSAHRSALLVLDMQGYFLHPNAHAYIPSAVAILPGISRLISAFYARNRPVCFTRHLNTEADAGMMSRWWRDLITPQSSYSQLVDALDTSQGILLEKTRYDAFWETHLDDFLQQNGVEQLVISGVMTHLCCETTARSAFMHGYEVFFLVDGTAAYTEAHHRATLLNLAHGFALPVSVSEILGLFQ